MMYLPKVEWSEFKTRLHQNLNGLINTEHEETPCGILKLPNLLETGGSAPVLGCSDSFFNGPLKDIEKYRRICGKPMLDILLF